ncbi:ABC transporter permease [Deinococcus cellulosilyticus]|uniref:ABC transporter permease n=1 Tax=Deinococcus cellulosilyticus (strain DSM 18568 / NBRC 106333 / KACC 11606 / 5516J-15) TaxID=1223518 RepID=A0A511N3N5_DEIC1|nr:ABC transporter permease [Deinococcus cellulosilyticus]GEM47068.1 ABC transporter permease [Deinococcus cellulosilyticus NBRC 106333 = KACC 11606]
MTWETFLTTAFLASIIRSIAPLLLAALGGLFSERSGIVNIALEGIIIFGALAGAVATQLLDPTLGNAAPWVGWIAGALTGGLIGWIHAVVSIKYKADQVISGTAINLLAVGVPGIVLGFLYGSTTESKQVQNPLPQWGFTEELSFSPPVYFAFLMVIITWYVLYKTPYGLRIRATGEHPKAAASMGVNVYRIRYSAVIISGMLAGTAGVFLSIGNLNAFTKNMSAGIGFIALAALIFGKWTPTGVLLSTVLFGFFRALATQLGGGNLFPSSLVDMMPYLLTIIVLAFTGKSVGPKAVGKPYEG